MSTLKERVEATKAAQKGMRELERALAASLSVDTRSFNHVGKEMGEEDETILGTVYIFGVPHHCMFVRVREDVSTEPVTKGDVIQTGYADPYGRYDDVTRMCENGPAQTIKLPGFPGEWVCSIDPFED